MPTTNKLQMNETLPDVFTSEMTSLIFFIILHTFFTVIDVM